MVKVTKRVVVSCVTDEVVKITHPAENIGAERVHLLHYIKEAEMGNKDSEDRFRFYSKIYQKVSKEIMMFSEEVIEHDVETYNFDECFHTIYDILKEEENKGSDIYVNISGTPEYAAAAAIASMMMNNVTLFSVGVKASDVTVDYKTKLKQSYYDGELVGSAFNVHPPFLIKRFPLPTPDEFLLKSLKIFKSVKLGKRSNVNVIRELIRHGLWRFSSDDDNYKTSVMLENNQGNLAEEKDKEEYFKLQRKEAVLYQRAYINKWKKEGWIEKSDINGKRYELTDTGKRYVEIFCSDVVFRIE